MELTPIDFIAQMINSMKAREEGYLAHPRWGTLKDDLRTKYKTEAERIFKVWKEEEEEAQRNRNNIMKNAKIRHVGK